MTIEPWTAPLSLLQAALTCAEIDRHHPARRTQHLEAALSATGDMQRQLLLARLALDQPKTLKEYV